MGGVLLAAGVAALGGFAVQQLAGAGGLGGVQGLLSQENSGPQIATRCHKLFLFIHFLFKIPSVTSQIRKIYPYLH